MRICVATPLYPPDIGGPATYSKLLEQELPRRDVDVVTVSFGEVRHLPRALSHVVYFIKLLSRARGADSILALDPVSVGLPALCAAFILRKTFVVKVVGDFAWEQLMQRGAPVSVEDFQGQRFGLMTELRRFVERFVARRAARVIVPSNYLKGIVSQWGVSPKKVTVIYNAFHMPERVPTKEEAREELGLSGQVIVSAGRLETWKGFETLIDALPDISDTQLVIAGDGPEQGALEQHARERGVAERVTFTGRVPHEKLITYLAAADVFALVSSYEGLSHILLEAMAVGVPVIASEVGGNPELVRHGQEGLLVPYGNPRDSAAALSRLLIERDSAQKLAANARIKAQQFSTERMLTNTIQLFSNLTSTK